MMNGCTIQFVVIVEIMSTHLMTMRQYTRTIATSDCAATHNFVPAIFAVTRFISTDAGTDVASLARQGYTQWRR